MFGMGCTRRRTSQTLVGGMITQLDTEFIRYKSGLSPCPGTYLFGLVRGVEYNDPCRHTVLKAREM